MDWRLSAIIDGTVSKRAAANGAATGSSNFADTTDIEVQRIYFESISDELIALVQLSGPVGYTVYHQSCPMVRDGSAEWLSREGQIANPYHIYRMLRCGELIKRL